MKNVSQNYLIDLLGFMCFLFLTSTGIIMHYLLPAGSGHDLGLLGLNRHDWGSIHFWTSIVFFGVITLHLIWHWKWIYNIAFRRHKEEFNWRGALGIVGLVSILFLSLGPLLIKPSSLEGTEIKIEQKVRGSMSLQQIEEATGVPATYLIKELNLPQDIDTEIPIQSLKDQQGFGMEKVRVLVNNYEH